MSLAGHFSLEAHPPTRHLRFKRILVVDQDDHWSRPIRDALERRGFYLQIASGPRETARRLHERLTDLVLVSTFAGDKGLGQILAELQAIAVPPPVIVVAALKGETRWEKWQALPQITIIRQPFTIDDIVEAALAILGNPWIDADDRP